jgi:hypothetical protein
MLGHARLLFAPGPDSPIFDITYLFKSGVSLAVLIDRRGCACCVLVLAPEKLLRF